MARMFPSEVSSFTTAGEKSVYRFLSAAARPDSTHLCWYSPDIEDREPDFILFSPDCGLIVLEVKDWVLDQIIELDPKSALLKIGANEERREQPLAQARKYVNHILSLFDKNPDPAGSKRACPVTWGAVFPHIARSDWRRAGLDKILDEKKILFWDEIREDSLLLQDASGASFRSWLAEHFPPLFAFTPSPALIDWIRQLIFPVIRLHLPRKPSIASQAQALLCLDSEQENMAKNLGGESLLIKGPAGSGKTMLLAARAAWLPRVNRKASRLLVTCFNLSLAGYIRRMMLRKGDMPSHARVDVIPFYRLCEAIVEEPLAHTNEGQDYYTLVVEECIERLTAGHPLQNRWDAILVDEGQDFSEAMANVILRLLPPHGSLTIASDDNQRLYQQQDGVWENMSIPGLRCRRLGRQYRNTRQIARFAANHLGIDVEDAAGAAGRKPEFLYSSDALSQVAKIADAVAALVRSGEPMSEIAVLYFSSHFDGSMTLPEALINALEERGVLARWLSRDISSKNFYDITTDSVTISTIHSAKGMDYANVFLVGFDEANMDANYRRLAYVGMTRARERLTLCCIQPKAKGN